MKISSFTALAVSACVTMIGVNAFSPTMRMVGIPRVMNLKRKSNSNSNNNLGSLSMTTPWKKEKRPTEMRMSDTTAMSSPEPEKTNVLKKVSLIKYT